MTLVLSELRQTVGALCFVGFYDSAIVESV